MYIYIYIYVYIYIYIYIYNKNHVYVCVYACTKNELLKTYKLLVYKFSAFRSIRQFSRYFSCSMIYIFMFI